MSTRPRLRIGSIPVHVEWPFFLIAALLGADLIRRWPGNRLVFLFVWVAIVFVSILVHELGHAFAYRLNSQHPKITITAFWGLTEGQRELPKWRSVVVSLSGVTAALVVLWLPAYLLRDQVLQATHSLQWYLIVYEIGYINLWWSLANLLPLLPLDGGQVVRTIWGLRLARFTSLASGAAAAVWLFIIGAEFAAIFIAMLALMNLAEGMQEGYIGKGRGFATGVGGGDRYERYEPPPPPPRPAREKRSKPKRRKRGSPDLTIVPSPSVSSSAPRPLDASRLEAAAWDALRVGDSTEAESLLLEATGRGGVSPHLTASVAAAQGRADESVRLFVLAFGVVETPPNLVVARVIAKAGIAVPLAEALLDDPTVEVDATAQLQNHLHFAGAYRDAAQVGERLVSDGRRSVAQSSYEVACSWSKAGDPEAGLAWLNRAVESGFRAPRLIEGEDDLAAVRALPGYADLLRTLHDG
jgi:Zn-dependent protease